MTPLQRRLARLESAADDPEAAEIARMSDAELAAAIAAEKAWFARWLRGQGANEGQVERYLTGGLEITERMFETDNDWRAVLGD